MCNYLFDNKGIVICFEIIYEGKQRFNCYSCQMNIEFKKKRIDLIFFVVSLITSALLVLSVKKNIELVEKLENLSESIEESIDVLQEQYEVIEKKTKIEVFSDEPVVRELIEDMRIAKNSVIKAAKILDDSLELD